MAKSLKKKQLEVSALTDKLARMKVGIMTTIAGLTVKDSTNLRALLRGSEIDFMVAKKTLVKKAFISASIPEAGLDQVNTSFGLAFGYGDQVLPAKLLAQFAKTHDSLTFLGGILDGRYVDAKEMIALSKLPSRDELRARLVGAMASPLTGLARVLAANLSGLARVISAYRERLANAPVKS